MNLETLIDEWNINSETIILEPQSDFNKSIVGVSEDCCHLVYSYEKMVKSLAEAYSSEMIAREWIEYNTIRALPYMNQDFVPIIIHEFSVGEENGQGN